MKLNINTESQLSSSYCVLSNNSYHYIDKNNDTYTFDTYYELPIPYKEEYKFAGWFDENGNLIESGVFNYENISLYAQWTPYNTVEFNGNGADGGSMDKMKIAMYDTDILISNGFSKTGYHFIGWSKSPSGIVEYENNDYYTMGQDENYILYAQWEPSKYVITYNTNNGTITKNSKEVIYDSDFSLDIPTRYGYTFLGWYYDNNQVTDLLGNSVTKYLIANDITVVAKWTGKTNSLVLTDGENTKTLFGETESLIRLPKNEYVKEGYQFAGWSNQENGDVLYYDQDLYLMGPDSINTLFAIFEQVQEAIDRTGWIGISTPAELASINNNLSGKYYLLNDIDMYGVIDGNGYAIYNLSPKFKCFYVETSSSSYTDYYLGSGLIALNNGTLTNIKLYNCNTTYNYTQNGWSSSYVISDYIYGSLLCAYNYGSIINCHVQGTITIDTNNTGVNTTGKSRGSRYLRVLNLFGIAGHNGGTIENCKANVSFSSNTNANMGEITDSSTNNCLTFSSNNPVYFNEGYIWYSLSNGTYRYQEASIHRLVNVYDSLESQEGYIFNGWKTSIDGSLEYIVGDECYIPYDKTYLVLYPDWSSNLY